MCLFDLKENIPLKCIKNIVYRSQNKKVNLDFKRTSLKS